jgi:hypothetical protein
MTRIADDFEAISQRLRELQQQLRKDSPTQRRIGVDDLDPSWPDPKLTRPIQCGVCMDVGWLLVSKLPGTPPANSIIPACAGPLSSAMPAATREKCLSVRSRLHLNHARNRIEQAGAGRPLSRLPDFWQAGKARFPSPEWRAQ